jgi:16S rRNA U1498 N3-methylase RsmE
VLRAKIGDQIMVQIPLAVSDCDEGRVIHRYTCSITVLAKSHIEATILQCVEYTHESQVETLAVALTNRFEKIELIVQKATEM